MKLCPIKRSAYLVTLIVLVFTSCTKKDGYENAEEFTYDDFKSSKELKSKDVLLDSMIMEPNMVFLMDSLLLVMEDGREKCVYVYDLKSKKQIAAQINKGQGPDDMIYPEIIGSSDTTIAIFGTSGTKLFIYDKKDFSNEKYAYPIQKIDIKRTSSIDAEFVGNKLLRTSYDNEYQMTVLDVTTNELRKIVPYPVSNVDFTRMEKQEAFYMNFTTNKKDRIAIAHYMTDLLEIYDFEGNLIKRLYGPEHFISKFKEFRDGDIGGARPVKGANKNTFFSPQSTTKNIYVLYNGKSRGDKDYSSSCKVLLSFSWDGTPQTIYNLDTPIFNFTVDEKQHKIYGIAEDPEYKIVEFDL